MSEAMTAIGRLEEALNERDARIEELEEELRGAERRIEQADGGMFLPESLPKDQTLPVPRLECRPALRQNRTDEGERQ